MPPIRENVLIAYLLALESTLPARPRLNRLSAATPNPTPIGWPRRTVHDAESGADERERARASWSNTNAPHSSPLAAPRASAARASIASIT